MAGDFNIAPARVDGRPNLRTFPHQHVLNRADFLSKFLGQEKQDVEKSRGKEGQQNWQGVDVWRAMNPDTRRFTYFPRSRDWGSSCDRVDYVIAGKRLWDTGRVTGAGILDSEAERGTSDHVPIWAGITMNPKPQELQNTG